MHYESSETTELNMICHIGKMTHLFHTKGEKRGVKKMIMEEPRGGGGVHRGALPRSLVGNSSVM